MASTAEPATRSPAAVPGSLLPYLPCGARSVRGPDCSPSAPQEAGPSASHRSREPTAATTQHQRLTVLYPCRRCVYQRRWWEHTIFAGHRVLCHEAATAEDVRAAEVVAASFVNPKRSADGWELQKTLLDRLGLSGRALVGKVLVHLDDEYGARTPRVPADWVTYCSLYAGWRHVFRNYWSQSWSSMVGRRHAMNCSKLVDTTAAFNPKVEWTPLGWSSNWEPGRPWRPTSRRALSVGFYGNEKYQLRPNRATLIARFEREAGAVVDGRMLGRVGFGRGNASEYVRLMHDTGLCLQISGLSAECYRMYEALDSGCVPLLINEYGNPSSPSAAVQYQFLVGRYGRAPFPFVHGPAELREWLARARVDPAALDSVQVATMRWWNQSLARLRARVVEHGRAVWGGDGDGQSPQR